MYILGTDRCQIRVTEPATLVVALYIRETAGLEPELDYPLPPLDPPINRWPVWASSPPPGWRPPAPAELSAAEKQVAAGEWIRWWNHLLDSDSTFGEEFHPPGFIDYKRVPHIQSLMQRYYSEAARWSEATMADPRVRRELDNPRIGLAAMIEEMERDPLRSPAPFQLRLTVLPVATKHAWPLTLEHILVTQPLIADTDNILDWVRPRVRRMANMTVTPQSAR